MVFENEAEVLAPFIISSCLEMMAILHLDEEKEEWYSHFITQMKHFQKTYKKPKLALPT